MVAFNEKIASKTTSVTSVKQNEAINLFRIIICFLVVSGHVHSNTSPAYQSDFISNLFCVPFFFSTALFFFTKNLRKKPSITSILKNSWLRIGIPFIAWSSVYLALLLIKHTITGSGQVLTIPSLIRAYLYGESAQHLYYLPELLVMQVLILSIYAISKDKKTMLGWFLLSLSVFYLGWGYMHKYYGLTPLLAIVVYILCAFLLTVNAVATQHKKMYFLMGVLLFVIISVYPQLYYSSSPQYSLPISGIGLLLIALGSRSFTIPTWLQLAASATYGIYLSHVLFLEAFEFILEKMHTQLFYTLPVKLSVALFILLISLVFTLIVQKIPFLRVLLLGEKQ